MSKKSKENIARTLLRLMESHPFDTITISEICDNSSVVRKTFYNNFVSKVAVISHLVESLVYEYGENIKEEGSYDPREMAYLYFCFGDANRNILSLLIKNKLTHVFQEQFEQLLPSINPYVPKNRLLDLDNEDLHFVYAFHTAGVVRLLEIWIATGCKKSPREMSDVYHTISLGIQMGNSKE